MDSRVKKLGFEMIQKVKRGGVNLVQIKPGKQKLLTEYCGE